MNQIHTEHMSYCLKLAKIALQNGNPPVGCILTLNNKIIGEGIESGRSTGDITNHAEILAVRDAINKGFSDDLNNCTLYTTHEPCIMCSYLIRHHKIPLIFYGSSVKYVGGRTSKFNVLSTEEVPNWGQKPEIIGGILENECSDLTRSFLDSLK